MQPKNATAKDVAARAGVSRSLVSMYLSRNPNVWISEETRARLDAAIRELGYRPNRSAQILRGGKSRVIGVVLGGISGLFASCLSEALMENLEEAGYRVFLGITRYDPERERRVLESMMNFEIDALVYTLEPDYVSDLLLRCSARIPVFLTERKEAYPFHSVQFDLSEALGKTMKFLSDRKVEKVALMTNRIGFAETLFLKAGENSRMKLRVFRAESTSGDDRKFLKELSRFRPDAVIVLAGVRADAAWKLLGPETIWIDSWSLPFQRTESGSRIRPAGSIVRPFRPYAEALSGALLETLQNSGDTVLHRSISALFLKRKERKVFRETLLNDPYFQAFEH